MEEMTIVPIDGNLDLHPFRPQDVAVVIPDYLRLCREQGLLQVRLIHGKGRGVRLRQVHALLERLPEVVAFELATADAGGWGATWVQLRPCAEAK